MVAPRPKGPIVPGHHFLFCPGPELRWCTLDLLLLHLSVLLFWLDMLCAGGSSLLITELFCNWNTWPCEWVSLTLWFLRSLIVISFQMLECWAETAKMSSSPNTYVQQNTTTWYIVKSFHVSVSCLFILLLLCPMCIWQCLLTSPVWLCMIVRTVVAFEMDVYGKKVSRDLQFCHNAKDTASCSSFLLKTSQLSSPKWFLSRMKYP